MGVNTGMKRSSRRIEMKDIRDISESRGVNANETGRQFCTRYELGQVASGAERVLVWYVLSGMHKLQDELHSFVHLYPLKF